MAASKNIVRIRSALRQKFSGVTTTVFGGGGYLGHDVVNAFARIGSQVLVPYRGDGLHMRQLKVAGDLGQVVTVPMCDIRSVDELTEMVSQSSVVVNLIRQSNFPVRINPFIGQFEAYRRTDVEYAANIAEACTRAGVQRLVHFSDLAQNINHPYEPLRYKAMGERAVMAAFPNATIIRPGPVFGPADRFIQEMALWFKMSAPIFPVFNGEQELQPVFLEDVSHGVLETLGRADAAGKTYEFCGPEVYLLEELFKQVCVRMYEDPLHNKMFRFPNNLRVINFVRYMLEWHRWFKVFMYKTPEHSFERQMMDISSKHNATDVHGRPVGRLQDLGVSGERLSERLQNLLLEYRVPNAANDLADQNSPDTMYQYFSETEEIVKKAPSHAHP